MGAQRPACVFVEPTLRRLGFENGFSPPPLLFSTKKKARVRGRCLCREVNFYSVSISLSLFLSLHTQEPCFHAVVHLDQHALSQLETGSFISHGGGELIQQPIARWRKSVDMVTFADLQTFADQLRPELSQRVAVDTLTAAVSQIRAEMTSAITNRTDQLNSIATAMQRIETTAPRAARSHRISDRTPMIWEGGID